MFLRVVVYSVTWCVLNKRMAIVKSMLKYVKSFMVKVLLSRKKMEQDILTSSILNSIESEVVKFNANASKPMKSNSLHSKHTDFF